MPNLSNLLSVTRSRCGIRNDTSFDSDLTSYLNLGQQNITTRYLFDIFREYEDISTVASTENYNLSAEGIIYSVTNTTSQIPLRCVRQIDLSLSDPAQSFTGVPAFYIIQGQYKATSSSVALPKFSVYPIPSAVYTLRTRYYKRISDLVNSTDVSEIPSAFHELLINYACYLFFSGQNDTRATAHYDLYENGLKDMVDQLGAVPVDQIDVVRSIDDIPTFGLRLPSNYPSNPYL